uniref:myotubularin-related protein 12-like n=1 Tax=Oncorhynchus gorbuscha TaxID=8017 RepID=UPI001EAF88BD|nr:myotubularin-related protein 12-like [Oncorhynchus gorbuscha]
MFHYRYTITGPLLPGCYSEPVLPPPVSTSSVCSRVKQPVPYTVCPHTPSLTVCLSWQAESPHTQRSPLNCPTVWDWSVQFDCKAQDLFTNPLYTEKPKQETSVRKSYRPRHLRQLSLPSSAFKTPPKKGFFKDEADNLKKILGVKRLSRWMLSPSSDSPQTSSSVREFYEAWQTKPLDYHGLLLPCLDGPSIRVWMQRYLPVEMDFPP